MSADEEVPGREVAYRLFAAEYDDASLSYAESDEERAPNYVVTPTGARLNRVFAVGTLTEVTRVNDEMVRARVVDPTGAFVVYAGQYQPDELAALESIDPPAFVAVTGKARTFEPDDGDRVYTSIRPESVATVDAETRDRWVVAAAERTLDRIGAFAAAADLDADGEALTGALREADVDTDLAAGIPLARDHYGTTPSYLAALRECALEAAEAVAGERDQVSGLDLGPGDETDPTATFETFADRSFEAPATATAADAAASAEPVAATVGGSEAAASGSVVGTAAAADSTDATADADSTDATADADSTDTTAADDDASADSPDARADASDGEDERPDSRPQSAEPTDEDDSPPTESTEPESAADAEPDGLEDADAGGMYEMDDEEREELEAEFGAEFTTGAEVDEPGAADIDVPDPDEPEEVGDEDDVADDDESTADASDDLGAAPTSGLEPDAAESADESDSTGEADADDAEPDRESTAVAASDDGSAEPTEDDAASDDDAAEDVDLESYVVETMEELDDGDGADRSELVDTVADETGASPADVESAIDDALMGGQCYEPDDETLKAI